MPNTDARYINKEDIECLDILTLIRELRTEFRKREPLLDNNKFAVFNNMIDVIEAYYKTIIAQH